MLSHLSYLERDWWDLTVSSLEYLCSPKEGKVHLIQRCSFWLHK